jgi:pyridoxal phosphate enzyme (YggS family)
MDSSDIERVMIAENIESVKRRIEQAARRSSRAPDSVRLVAVSKSQSLEKVRQAYELGLRVFGENRVYEAIPRQEQLKDLPDIQWHMIGHIQSRKARDVPGNFSVVHSVDRMKIARRLNQFSGEAGKRLKVYLECNVSGEGTKEGWDLVDPASWPKVIPIFTQIIALQHLQVSGLMTMAPMDVGEALIRKVFRSLRELKDYLSEELPGSWDDLSMGMTDDFEIAIEEGSTVVRIGRAIFGPRDEG